MWRSAALIAALAAPARADRPDHGSFSAGGTLLVTGDNGDHQRGELEVDVEPHSRYGALLAWRGFDRGHGGLLCAGLIYEAAAARPTLVLAFHADAGVDLDQHAPMLGGGLRTTIALLGPVGFALDSGAYLVIDGLHNTRLAIGLGLAAAVAF